MRPSIPRVKVRQCAELRKNMQLSYCKSDQSAHKIIFVTPPVRINNVILGQNLKKN